MPLDRKQQLAETAGNINAKFAADVQTITAAEVMAAQNEDVKSKMDSASLPSNIILVDTRTAAEISVSTIKNAVTADEFWSKRHEYKDCLIIPYCTVGYRSAKYAQKLQEDGFCNVKNLDGGIIAWTHEQGPLVAPAPAGDIDDGAIDISSGHTTTIETKRVHVFGEQWELQAQGYEAVKFKTPYLSYAMSSIRSTVGKLFGR